MINKNNVHLLRFINIILLAVTIIFQYNCNFSLKISSANPMLPICLLVAICMFCSELTAALSGLIVGVFIDSTAATIQGFNAIMFLIIGLATSLIVKHLFNNNVFSSIALCAIACTIYLIVRWLTGFAFSLSFTENITYLIRFAFPSVLYSAIFTLPFYFIEKYLYQKLYK